MLWSILDCRHLQTLNFNGGIHQMLMIRRVITIYASAQTFIEKIQRYRESTKVFYNRVPKCGSTTTLHLISKFRKKNNYTHYHSKVYFYRNITQVEQETIINKTKLFKGTWIYDRHVHFLNFIKFHEEMPVYINLVRHPVPRFISRFKFGHYVTHDKKLSINTCIEEKQPLCSKLSIQNETLILVPFFCGQEEFCQHANEKAMSVAKKNVQNYYAVVGILDKYDLFLRSLECLLPQFFKGVHEAFTNLPTVKLNKSSYKKFDQITVENKRKLETTLQFDIKFYYFLKQHFNNFVRQSISCKLQ